MRSAARIEAALEAALLAEGGFEVPTLVLTPDELREGDAADAWIEDQDFKDPDTGQLLDRDLLNQELTKIEKPAGIANPKDFRNEVVKFSLRSRAHNGGKNPSWTSYEKVRDVIEKRIFSQVEDLLPVISFGSKKDGETEKKHGEFVERIVARGNNERRVRSLERWYKREKQKGCGRRGPV